MKSFYGKQTEDSCQELVLSYLAPPPPLCFCIAKSIVFLELKCLVNP